MSVAAQLVRFASLLKQAPQVSARTPSPVSLHTVNQLSII